MRPRPANKIYDISMVLDDSTPAWPSADRFELKWLRTFPDDGYNESALSLNSHSGTHLDSPLHFVENGQGCDELPLELLIGEAFVLDCGDAERVDPGLLENALIPPGCLRLLLKTRNSRITGSAFARDYVALTAEGAAWLVDRGIRLVGIDYLSIEPFGSDGGVHRKLLGSGVVVLEGLVLAAVREGSYQLVALPLKVGKSEGAPARVILMEGEDT
ncbi:cyclase family protein [Geomonas sp.]|uniref:cyclase family protein n=1 Tax=Geomonas sp. TaxID=2651584 RepID=UPI002B463423|nr:cyclase family protein [Geomonas sp.]HJV35775.1 cyclase family protein [Geomonas sp.]